MRAGVPLAASSKSFHYGSSTAPSHKNLTLVETVAAFSAEDLLFINASLDWGLEESLGYRAYHE